MVLTFPPRRFVSLQVNTICPHTHTRDDQQQHCRRRRRHLNCLSDTEIYPGKDKSMVEWKHKLSEKKKRKYVLKDTN